MLQGAVRIWAAAGFPEPLPLIAPRSVPATFAALQQGGMRRRTSLSTLQWEGRGALYRLYMSTGGAREAAILAPPNVSQSSFPTASSSASCTNASTSSSPAPRPLNPDIDVLRAEADEERGGMLGTALTGRLLPLVTAEIGRDDLPAVPTGAWNELVYWRGCWWRLCCMRPP